MAKALLVINDPVTGRPVIALGPDGQPLVGDPATGEGWDCCCGGGGGGSCTCCFTTDLWPVTSCAGTSTPPFTCCDFGSSFDYEVQYTMIDIQREPGVFNERYDETYRMIRRYDCLRGQRRILFIHRIVHTIDGVPFVELDINLGESQTWEQVELTQYPLNRADNASPSMFDADQFSRGQDDTTCTGSRVFNDGNGTYTFTWDYVPTSCVGVTWNNGLVRVDHAYRQTKTHIGMTKFHPKLAPCKDVNGDDCFPCSGSSNATGGCSDCGNDADTGTTPEALLALIGRQ